MTTQLAGFCSVIETLKGKYLMLNKSTCWKCNEIVLNSEHIDLHSVLNYHNQIQSALLIWKLPIR